MLRNSSSPPSPRADAARHHLVYGEEQDFFERDAIGEDLPARGGGDWQAAGSDAVAGEGAPLGGDNDAGDNCSEPVEFDEAVVLEVGVADGRAGMCALVVVPRITTELDGRRGGGPISVVVLGEDGGMVVLGEDGSVVVPDDCRSSVSLRWPALVPGQANTPAKTRTATAAAATTAAPITHAATT